MISLRIKHFRHTATAPKEEPRSIVHHSSGSEMFATDARHVSVPPPPPTSVFDDQVKSFG